MTYHYGHWLDDLSEPLITYGGGDFNKLLKVFYPAEGEPEWVRKLIRPGESMLFRGHAYSKLLAAVGIKRRSVAWVDPAVLAKDDARLEYEEECRGLAHAYLWLQWERVRP